MRVLMMLIVKKRIAMINIIKMMSTQKLKLPNKILKKSLFTIIIKRLIHLALL